MTPQNPFGRRHPRSADHVQTCTACGAALTRERQYIQRLREAPIPPASEDLAARLLARTELLAAVPAPARAPHRVFRTVAFTAGGTAAAAGMLAVTAFALAGDGLPLAGPAMQGSLVQHAAQLPADGGELSEPQLSALRSGGWICPELEDLGFQIRSAKATTVNGLPAVEMFLSDGHHYATVVEQHPAAAGRPATAGEDMAELRISSVAPWTATYKTAAGTFSVESDLPAERADDALPLLQKLSEQAVERVRAESAAAQASAPDDLPAVRLERGIRKIAEMLTR